MGSDSALLCVEAEPALAALTRNRMPSELADDPRIVFLETSSPEEAVAAARGLGSFRACVVEALSGGAALRGSTYRAMAAALSAEFEAAWRNRAALLTLGPRWARNIFDNLAALPGLAPRSLPRFSGPVVVCGAGPSLEEALPLIEREKGRGGVAVVTCDTALGSLLAAGVQPDLVVCLEGQAHNLPDFTCIGSGSVDLAADLSSHPATFHAVRGPKRLTFVRITRSPFLDRAAAALTSGGIPFLPAPPLGSVGVHAVHIARLISSGPLLLTGLDFSFEPGKTHARGCPSLLAEDRRLDRLERWTGQYASSFRDRNIAIDGPRLLSDPILLSYAALLADHAAEDVDRELYDIRGRGPAIGCRRITFEEAAEVIDRSRKAAESMTASRETDSPREDFDRGRAARCVLALLSDEKTRLASLRASMHGSRVLPREDFVRLVAESDYLWWGFPDQDRARELPQDFLNRLVPQAEYWSCRIAALVDSVAALV
jgi:hypothetical protein